MVPRILVVDDEAPIRVVITGILNLAGFETATAEDGTQALALLATEDFDMVVCDMKMPKIDGFGVLRHMQLQYPDRLLPFIFVTSNAAHQDIRQGMGQGAWDYITKPFTHDELLASIRAQLAKIERFRLNQAADQLNLSLVEQLDQDIQRLDSLKSAKQQVSPNIDLILKEVVDLVQRNLGFDRCSFLWSIRRQYSPIAHSLDDLDNLENPPDSTAPPSPQTPPAANASKGDTNSSYYFFVTHEAKAETLGEQLGELTPEQGQILQPFVLQDRPQILDLHSDQPPPGPTAPALQSIFEPWGVDWFMIIPLATHAGQSGAFLCGGHGSYQYLKQTIISQVLDSIANRIALIIQKTDYQAQNRAISLAAETQKKHLQEALKSLQQAQSHLVQSEKMSSLGQLVAGVAHEINNPVNFIAGNVAYAASYAQDLIQLVKLYQRHVPDPPEEIQAYLEDIDFEFLEQDYQRMFQSMQTGTDRIRDIVTSLRNFSRLDQADIKPVDIHEGIESTLMILEHRLKPYGRYEGIEVQRFYGDLPLVECFAGQLNQVFMNLLSNAIDALGSVESNRQIQITTSTLRSAPHLPEDDRVQISIRDNGTGMNRATQENIFNPFFTTKPPGQGTGLGLSISYKIVVERHRGQLRCYSQLQQGTQFLVEIPIHHPEMATSADLPT